MYTLVISVLEIIKLIILHSHQHDNTLVIVYTYKKEDDIHYWLHIMLINQVISNQRQVMIFSHSLMSLVYHMIQFELVIINVLILQFDYVQIMVLIEIYQINK